MLSRTSVGLFPFRPKGVLSCLVFKHVFFEIFSSCTLSGGSDPLSSSGFSGSAFALALPFSSASVGSEGVLGLTASVISLLYLSSSDFAFLYSSTGRMIVGRGGGAGGVSVFLVVLFLAWWLICFPWLLHFFIR